MEIDECHQADSTSIRRPVIATTEGQQPTPKIRSASEQQASDHGNENEDEENSDSDSGPMACPLFMDSLPRDFATNPQLAAIASLLNDEVPEEVDAGNDSPITKAIDENDASHNAGYAHVHAHAHAHASSYRHRSLSSTRRPYTQATKSISATSTRHRTKSTSTQHRRQQQRASPYPRQQDRKNEKQATATKSTSVGEITLFMNMWKA